MRYLSTRGIADAVGYEEALLRGLAPDGGLYVPETWPRMPASLAVAARSAPFAEIAAEIASAFVGDAIPRSRLHSMARDAYASFDRPAVAPLVAIGPDDYLLELFHGPTLAFKDVAMQFLARLFADALSRRSERIAIIGATSGDTGAAAIEAFRSVDRAAIFILHPKGRVSDVQRRIMTSVDAPNVVNIAVEGSFDDCQRIVKTLFADAALQAEAPLGGINSINWMRLALQIAYYFTAAAQVADGDARVSFSVPTGNFGDAFAGYAAKRMGLAIDRLCIAVNENDILDRALRTGRYEPHGVAATTSPSMDIQVASNFERLVFEAGGRDPDRVRAFIGDVGRPGGAAIHPPTLATMREDFTSERASDAEAAAMIADVRQRTGRLVDPHTAVGLVAAAKARAAGALGGPVITLATAHPAKFPEAVRAAAGVEAALPSRFSDLYDRPERCETAANDAAAVKAILLRTWRRLS